MTVDVLIAGGGIAGLLLARALRARGRSVRVANDPARPAAAQAAVGLLNPVLGQRFTLAWQAATALPVARAVYATMARDTGIPLLHDLPLIRCLQNDEELAAWNKRAAGIAAAGFAVTAAPTLPRGFRHTGPGAFAIHGTGLVDAWALVDTLRRSLVATGSYVDCACRAEDVTLAAGRVIWTSGAVEAGALVLAGGAADTRTAGNLTYYADIGAGHALPVRAVKGESLLIAAPALAADAVVVSGHFLAPRGDGWWICGATQEPDVANTTPTPEARVELEEFLRTHLTVRWQIIDQRAGVRPVTPDLRPILGRYLDAGPVYVCNGFGSRGIALGPWLAETLAAHLVDGAALPAEMLPGRFASKPAEGRCSSPTRAARPCATTGDA